jgi:tRNA A37 threonylcarbamoyladenosine dehydratase
VEDQFARTRILLGDKAVDRLAQARVAVFGIGGVGGYVCEALARSGVGALDLIDSDKVSLTNINRQIIATHDTLGRYKTEVMRERILSVNPQADVRTYQCFFLPETAEQFSFAQYDYVVDAVDTVTAKIELVLKAKAEKVPIISSMGAGNKLDAGAFQVADIYETKVCPLAKVMRRELRKRQVEHLKVVYSQEEPARLVGECVDGQEKRRAIPGSVAFVPSVAGLMIAGEVVKDLVSSV